MKTIKVIDLLNKIANGEVPKKIKVDNIYTYIHDGIDYKNRDGAYLFDSHIETTPEDMNIEVEILEEEKKIPEKINLYEETQNIIRENNYKLVYHDIHKCIVSLECKYNQLIDYLKSKETGE